MNEMIERVAKAIDLEAFEGTDRRGPLRPDAAKFRRDQALTKARAAIEAMHEPTEAMIDAGVSADTGRTMGSRVTLCWKTMIDAALPKD